MSAFSHSSLEREKVECVLKERKNSVESDGEREDENESDKKKKAHIDQLWTKFKQEHC